MSDDVRGKGMFHFHALGALEVVSEDGPVALGGPRQRAVLAVLLINANHIVSVDQLIAAVWAESPPPRAIGTLQAYVSNLRRVLEPERRPGAPPEIVVSRAPGYSLVIDPESVDFLRFRRLADEGRRRLEAGDHHGAEHALALADALWRGRAFADFTYEPFAQDHIAALERRRLDALEDLFEARLGLGRHADVLDDLERLARQESLRERLCAQLMVALYRSGRQGDALRAYESLRETLSAELGVDPSPEVRHLHERIVRQDASLSRSGPPGIPPEQTISPPEPDARPAATRPLVGRDEEMSVVLRAAEAARRRGRVLLIEGEAGIGKTYLVDAAIDHAASTGALVLRGHCEEDEASGCYHPWVQIARDLVTASPALHRPISAETQRTLGVDRGTDAAAWTIDAHTDGSQVAAQIVDAIVELSTTRPVLVVQEDLHWSNDVSLGVLRRLCREAAAAPVLVVGTLRNVGERSSAALVETLADLTRSGAERMLLTGFSHDDVAEFVTSVTGVAPDPAVAGAIRERTGGNPFFVSELVALLASDKHLDRSGPEAVMRTTVPRGVSDVVRRRIARLPDDVHELIATAAAIGVEFDLDIVFDAAALEGDRALEAAEAATIAGVLREVQDGGGRYAFAHALARDTVLDDLGAIGRARRHGMIADVLLARYGEDPDHLVDIAWHLWRSVPTRPREPIVPYLAKAGELAMARTDFGMAERLLGKVIEAVRTVPPSAQRDEWELRAQYQLALARGRTLGTRHPHVRASVARVHELGGRLGRVRELLHALWYSFMDETVRGDTERAAEVAARMRADADASLDPIAIGFAYSSSGLSAFDRGRLSEARGYLRQGIEVWRREIGTGGQRVDPAASLFDPSAYRPDVMCLGYDAVVSCLLGDTVGSREALSNALEVSPWGTGGHAYPPAFAMYCRTWVDALRRDAVACAVSGTEASEFARDHGLRFFTSATTVMGGWGVAVTRDPRAGLASIEEGLAVGAGALGPMRRPMYLGLYAEALALDGALDRALAVLEEAIAFSEATGSNRFVLPELYRLKAVLLAQHGDSTDTQRLLDQALAEAQIQGSVMLADRVVASREGSGRADLLAGS